MWVCVMGNPTDNYYKVIRQLITKKFGRDIAGRDIDCRSFQLDLPTFFDHKKFDKESPMTASDFILLLIKNYKYLTDHYLQQPQRLTKDLTFTFGSPFDPIIWFKTFCKVDGLLTEDQKSDLKQALESYQAENLLPYLENAAHQPDLYLHLRRTKHFDDLETLSFKDFPDFKLLDCAASGVEFDLELYFHEVELFLKSHLPSSTLVKTWYYPITEKCRPFSVIKNDFKEITSKVIQYLVSLNCIF